MEEKRRLPTWMIGASAANKASKPLDLDPNDIITTEKPNVETKSTKPKSKSQTCKQKKEVSPSSDDKSFLVKCETKRKKRRIVEEDAIESHDFEKEAIDEKKKLRRVKKKDEEVHHSRKKKNAQSSDEDDDEDLTMEDLLTIAKQFVENDNKSDTITSQQKSSKELPKRNSSHSSSSMTTSSLIAPQDTKSHIHEQTSLHYESTENTKSKVISERITMTGDPAQDMLDLFLGPLLRKPIRKEEDSFIDDMILHHEVKKQQHDAVVSSKPVNLTKKKSSLRDAVAMLLD